MSCNCEELQLQVDKIREAVIGNGRLVMSLYENLEKRERNRKSLHLVKDQYERYKELRMFGKKFTEAEQADFEKMEAIVKEHF